MSLVKRRGRPPGIHKGRPKGSKNKKTRPLAIKDPINFLPKRVHDDVKRYRIFEMARSGLNAMEISMAMEKKGYDACSPDEITKVIRETLANLRTNSAGLIEEVREMAIHQIDNMIFTANKITSNPRSKAMIKLEAIKTIRTLIDEKARILGTLKAPEKASAPPQEIVVRIYEGLSQKDLKPVTTVEMERDNVIDAGTDIPSIEPGDDSVPAFSPGRLISSPSTQ